MWAAPPCIGHCDHEWALGFGLGFTFGLALGFGLGFGATVTVTVAVAVAVTVGVAGGSVVSSGLASVCLVEVCVREPHCRTCP